MLFQLKCIFKQHWCFKNRHIIVFLPPISKLNLTPCCGHEVYNPYQALQRVKDSGNTFDLNDKWANTLQLGILQEKFIEPIPNTVFDIWHPAVGLKWWISPRYLNNPGNIFDLIPTSRPMQTKGHHKFFIYNIFSVNIKQTYKFNEKSHRQITCNLSITSSTPFT